MADCGPINPLQQIAKHSQQDRSLQQDRVGSSGHHQQQQNLRSLQHSQQLDHEFLQRQGNLHHLQQHSNPQLNPQALHFQPPPHISQQQHQHQQANGAWANDFAKLSLNSSSASRQHQQGSWNDQFLQTQGMQQTQHLNHSQHQSSNLHSFHNQQMPLMRAPQVMLNQTTTSLHRHRSTEHAEAYHGDHTINNNHLEEEFQRIEASLRTPAPVEPQEQQPQQVLHNPNLEFQRTAQDISKAISSVKGNTLTSEKFKNSQFLNLMMSIGSGDITLNQDETKLVDNKGTDIHELKTQQQDRLPDPLEGLSKDDITSPFETAKKVGQNKGQAAYSWDEHYDDYRNEDTEF